MTKVVEQLLNTTNNNDSNDSNDNKNNNNNNNNDNNGDNNINIIIVSITINITITIATIINNDYCYRRGTLQRNQMNIMFEPLSLKPLESV